MHNAAPPELSVAQEHWMPTPLGVMQDDKKVYVSNFVCVKYFFENIETHLA